MLANMFDEQSAEVLKQASAVEEVSVNALSETIETYKKQLSLAEDTAALASAQSALMQEISASKTLSLQHHLRADMIKKLEAVQSDEQAVSRELQSTMVQWATDQVTASFTTADGADALRASAMDQALAAIKDPQNAAQALPAEVVSDIQSTMEAYAKRDGIEGVDVVAPTSVALGSV